LNNNGFLLSGHFYIILPAILLSNALGALLWSAAFALLGYGAGVSWRVVEYGGDGDA